MVVCVSTDHIIYISYIQFIAYPSVKLWCTLFIHNVIACTWYSIRQDYTYTYLFIHLFISPSCGKIQITMPLRILMSEMLQPVNKIRICTLADTFHPTNKARSLIILSSHVLGSVIESVHSTYLFYIKDHPRGTRWLSGRMKLGGRCCYFWNTCLTFQKLLIRTDRWCYCWG
jgi:hypothetical protein